MQRLWRRWLTLAFVSSLANCGKAGKCQGICGTNLDLFEDNSICYCERECLSIGDCCRGFEEDCPLPPTSAPSHPPTSHPISSSPTKSPTNVIVGYVATFEYPLRDNSRVKGAFETAWDGEAVLEVIAGPLENERVCLLRCNELDLCAGVFWFMDSSLQTHCHLLSDVGNLATPASSCSSSALACRSFVRDTVQECEQAPCGDYGACIDTPGSYSCDCLQGFELVESRCADVDECGGAVCASAFETCTNTPGSFVCGCDRGYAYGDANETCVDVDECADVDQTVCDDRALCGNEQGSFACACNAGWVGDGETCADADECDDDTHTCGTHSGCVNTIGSYLCPCNVGWEVVEGECVSRNECLADHTCHESAACVDTKGSFVCSCNQGWFGNGLQCIDVNECAQIDDSATQSCDDEVHTHCHNTLGSYTCACDVGWEVRAGSTECVSAYECLASPCDEKAACNDIEGSFVCTCYYGYSGDGTTCRLIDWCAEGLHNCAHDQDCHMDTTLLTYTCDCALGFAWSPRELECVDVDECDLRSACDVQAVCTNALGSFECECVQGYIGNGRSCVASPTIAPSSSKPTFAPTHPPTHPPTKAPSVTPTSIPTQTPTTTPTAHPTSQPSAIPSVTPSMSPTSEPTAPPSPQPSAQPSKQPSRIPSTTPTTPPTTAPSTPPTLVLTTMSPSGIPTNVPTVTPSAYPTHVPTRYVSSSPTLAPSTPPTRVPSEFISHSPTPYPSQFPTSHPSFTPSQLPTTSPSTSPTLMPTPTTTSVTSTSITVTSTTATATSTTLTTATLTSTTNTMELCNCTQDTDDDDAEGAATTTTDVPPTPVYAIRGQCNCSGELGMGRTANSHVEGGASFLRAEVIGGIVAGVAFVLVIVLFKRACAVKVVEPFDNEEVMEPVKTPSPDGLLLSDSLALDVAVDVDVDVDGDIDVDVPPPPVRARSPFEYSDDEDEEMLSPNNSTVLNYSMHTTMNNSYLSAQEFEQEKLNEANEKQHRAELQIKYTQFQEQSLAQHNKQDALAYEEAVRWRTTIERKEAEERAQAQQVVKSIIDKRAAEDEEYQRRQAVRKLHKKLQSQREVYASTLAHNDRLDANRKRKQQVLASIRDERLDPTRSVSPSSYTSPLPGYVAANSTPDPSMMMSPGAYNNPRKINAHVHTALNSPLVHKADEQLDAQIEYMVNEHNTALEAQHQPSKERPTSMLGKISQKTKSVLGRDKSPPTPSDSNDLDDSSNFFDLLSKSKTFKANRNAVKDNAEVPSRRNRSKDRNKDRNGKQPRAPREPRASREARNNTTTAINNNTTTNNNNNDNDADDADDRNDHHDTNNRINMPNSVNPHRPSAVTRADASLDDAIENMVYDHERSFDTDTQTMTIKAGDTVV